jgi:hypothetical protein
MSLSLAATCVSSATAIAAYHHLVTIPPDLSCDDLTGRWVSDRTRLSCAQGTAQGGTLPDLTAAMAIVADWPPHHPLFGEVQLLLGDWSATVLRAAQVRAAHQYLDWAMALVMDIPIHSPAYGEAQQWLYRWQQQRYRQIRPLYDQGQAALKEQHWATALEILAEMEDLEGDLWQTGLTARFAQDLAAERHASEQWAAASRLAFLEDEAALAQAIALGSQIDPQTYSGQQAQIHLATWSDRLLHRALAAWYRGDLNRAIAWANGVRRYPPRAAAAQHLVWLCRARQLALAGLAADQPGATAVGVGTAWITAQAIPPGSPFYPQAIAMAPSWGQQLGTAVGPSRHRHRPNAGARVIRSGTSGGLSASSLPGR